MAVNPEGCACGGTERRVGTACRAFNVERGNAINRAQREGYCLLDADDLCLTHNCGPFAPCGRPTCKHCRGDDGSGEDTC